MKKGKLIIGLGVGLVAVAGAVFGAKKYQEKTGKSLLDKLNEAETPVEALEVHKEQMTEEEMVKAALDEGEQEDEKSLLEIVKSNKVKVAIVGAVVATVGIVGKVLFSKRKNKKVNEVQEVDIDNDLKVQQTKTNNTQVNNNEEMKGGGYNPNADIVDMDLKDNSADMLGKE